MFSVLISGTYVAIALGHTQQVSSGQAIHLIMDTIANSVLDASIDVPTN